MDVVTLAIVIIVVLVILAIIHYYVVPALPHPWGVLIMAIVAILAVLYLAQRAGLV